MIDIRLSIAKKKHWKVLGFDRSPFIYPTPPDMFVSGKEWYETSVGEICWSRDAPNWTEDIRAAWSLMGEIMSKRCYSLTISFENEQWYVTVTDCEKGSHWGATDTTIELAICKVWLNWMNR